MADYDLVDVPNMDRKSYVLLSDGTYAKKVSMDSDIQIGAVEIKDATTTNRVEVDSNGALKVTGGASSVSAKYISPSDFTATYTSSTTLTLSGLPFTISDSAQLAYIKKISSTGDAEIYVNGANGVTMTVSSNVLTISGAGTPFASGDVYEVGINAQDKSYDSSTNSELVSTLKNVWNQQTSEETLTTNAALTATFTQIGADIDVREYPMLRTGVVVVVGTSTGITLRIVQKLADGSYIPIDGLADITLTESKSYVFDVPGIETVAFQVKDTAAGTGTVSLYYNKVWR